MIVDRKTADAPYRVNFGAFAYAAYEVVHPHEPLCPNWHIDCICHHLADGSRASARPPHSEFTSAFFEILFGVGRLGRLAAGAQAKPSDHLCQLFGRSLRINSPAIVGL
jgi:hypothetical protein